MSNKMNAVLTKISEDYKAMIDGDSRNYVEVSMARTAADLGLDDLAVLYKNTSAIVPLKQPLKGMKVRIDGRTFVNYVQHDNGIAVPGIVARESDWPGKPYKAMDSMICNYHAVD